MTDLAGAIDALTPDEQLDLLERLWDSLSRTPDRLPLTDAQRAELDRRLDSMDEDRAQGRDLGLPWEVMVRRIRKGG